MKAIVWFGLVLGALAVEGKVIVAKPGTKTTIMCGVPTFKYIEWFKGNQRILRDGKKIMFSKEKTDIASRSNLRDADLMINPVKKEDAGKFRCKVDSETYDHTLLILSVSANSSGGFQLGSEATLQCQVFGLNPSRPVEWVKPDGSPHTGSQLTRLTRSDEGTWTCKVSSGKETFSDTVTINVKVPATTVPAPESSQGSKDAVSRGGSDPSPDTHVLLGLSWWMWAVIGASALVALVLTVVVVLLSKRIKRRKRKLRMMQNGRRYCQCNRPAAAPKPRQGRRREKPSVPPLQPLLMA